MVDKLETCPFCGGEAELRESVTDEYIACCECGGRSGMIYLGPSDASNAAKRKDLIAAWNRRTPANGEQVERVKATCAAAKQGTAGGNDPADCDWPMCGCDPHADRVIAALQESGHLTATPTEDARSRVKVLEEARPFSEWHEDSGDVLWWKLPIIEPPYCGSPLDLGRGMKVTVQIGFEEHEMPIANTGGWPFTEEDEPDLWWTPLPSPTFFRTALGNKETDRHG